MAQDMPKAPKIYTPEHCNWVQVTMLSSLRAATETLALVTKGQEDLTNQAITDLSKDIEDLKGLKANIQSLRLWIYGGVITGLILMITGLFKFFSLLKGIPIPK